MLNPNEDDTTSHVSLDLLKTDVSPLPSIYFCSTKTKPSHPSNCTIASAALTMTLIIATGCGLKRSADRARKAIVRHSCTQISKRSLSSAWIAAFIMSLRGVAKSPTSAIEIVWADVAEGVEVAGMRVSDGAMKTLGGRGED